MAIAGTVEAFLRSHHVSYDLVRHPRAVTSMRAAEAAHVPGNQLAKSVLVGDEKGYLIAVIPSTRRLDLGKLHRRLERRMGLAMEHEVAELFRDCDPGAIPAIGAAYHVDVIIDDALLGQPDVYFEAGDHEALVHMTGKAFGAMMAGVPHGRLTNHM